MRNRRILINTYPNAFLYKGGGELELIDMKNGLCQLGIQADLYGPESKTVHEYDLFIHYSVIPSGLEQLRQLYEIGKPIILLPSIWWHRRPSQEIILVVESHFQLSNKIGFKSVSEYENVRKFADIDESKVFIYNWGVDSSFEHVVPANLFTEHHNVDNFALCIGIIEESKNQLSVINALKDQNIPIIFIGGYRDRNYYESCVRLSPKTFKFIPFLQPRSAMLRSALTACSIFIEMSLEPAGCSAIEAILAKKSILVSDNEWSREIFNENVVMANPFSSDDIVNGFNLALNNSCSVELVNFVHSKHLIPNSLENLVKTINELC